MTGLATRDVPLAPAEPSRVLDALAQVECPGRGLERHARGGTLTA